MNYFRVIGDIQNEIKKANCFDEAIKVGVQKILQAFIFTAGMGSLLMWRAAFVPAGFLLWM